ncbi:hypothetical protein ISN45_Aa02g014860 [Arabidopsis thaliana x Arabidopsis arenosa]|uniref:Uncharacterized protein n=1 Tax=Arabidopsis thaliana x Arabidopsis arenosa TaxID=1240361 RepID=A0A8T2BH43_9BRAS|nr:hypothetical protein ISN45_Aa02g014860 [Arabidopsis thaliana x Arabidopsis arenosa]KAG7586145.1 hypothetical protein ISN45_Aa02g014860 [Arabidopsis thaliana x Arabidopsis arenosa]KAG7586146.1 hypothetical protein ISN45_Aa02g014860 [Arabidopsis thaliana x Arabidopsis arenosa]KAG7586147.1 hypothetical protein ISN45_Aa02g014860 [Arabidopsis thaliana x Arabidopsis arenosa]
MVQAATPWSQLHPTNPLTLYSSFLQINQTVKLRFQKKFKKRVKDHGIFCSSSLDPCSSTLCGSDCNCGILLSSCSSSSKCRSDCTNKPVPTTIYQEDEVSS